MLYAFGVRCWGFTVRLQTTDTWDEDRVFGCVCDSDWAVGVEDGQRQAAEWFGADCSRREWAVDTHCCGGAAKISGDSVIVSTLSGHCRPLPRRR